MRDFFVTLVAVFCIIAIALFKDARMDAICEDRDSWERIARSCNENAREIEAAADKMAAILESHGIDHDVLYPSASVIITQELLDSQRAQRELNDRKRSEAK